MALWCKPVWIFLRPLIVTCWSFLDCLWCVIFYASHLSRQSDTVCSTPWQFSYLFVWVVQFLVLEHVAENRGRCFGCFCLRRAGEKKTKIHQRQHNVPWCATISYETSRVKYPKWRMLHASPCRLTHLLSCEDLMPTSLGRPSKKAMSLAAMELLVTRLLRTPQMLTTTSLEGSFWWPSLGSLVTRLFTTFVAAQRDQCR